MEEFINNIKQGTKLIIKNSEYIVKTKTWYTIEEDNSASYIKCELSHNKVLVVIPDDDLIYIGEVIPNMKYERISNEELIYNDTKYNKTGDGHQYITNIEFGNEDEVEGKCEFEDFESENNIISLGILTDKDNIKADVYAEILEIEDISIM